MLLEKIALRLIESVWSCLRSRDNGMCRRFVVFVLLLRFDECVRFFLSKANCCSASLFNVFVFLRLFVWERINWYWKKSCFDLVERVWNYLFSREASCCSVSPFCFRLSVLM